MLGIEDVDPRTDDLVPFDGPNVVPEQVGPDTPDQRDALELVVGGEHWGAGEQGITEGLGWRHVPFTARHGGNADPEGGLDPGQDVAVGAVARATPTQLGLSSFSE